MSLCFQAKKGQTKLHPQGRNIIALGKKKIFSEMYPSRGLLLLNVSD